MALKFIPQISYYANLYFFIQNLSEWHPSNRQKHNKEWKNRIKISDEDSQYLMEFREIHRQFPFGGTYLGRPFFLSDDPWSELLLLAGENLTIKVREIFKIFEPYFDIIYKQDIEALETWSKIISSADFISKSTFLNGTLSVFYGTPIYNESCNVFLLLSTKEKNGGTAGTIDDHTVTLELSNVDFKKEDMILGILWHELIHLYFRNYVFYPLLKKYTGNDQKLIGKLDELVASAFLPNGLLRKNIGEKNEQISLNARLDTKEIQYAQELIKAYLSEKKTVDEKFVQALCSVFVTE